MRLTRYLRSSTYSCEDNATQTLIYVLPEHRRLPNLAQEPNHRDDVSLQEWRHVSYQASLSILSSFGVFDIDWPSLVSPARDQACTVLPSLKSSKHRHHTKCLKKGGLHSQVRRPDPSQFKYSRVAWLDWYVAVWNYLLGIEETD